jgi:hypothetical protein
MNPQMLHVDHLQAPIELLAFCGCDFGLMSLPLFVFFLDRFAFADAIVVKTLNEHGVWLKP